MMLRPDDIRVAQIAADLPYRSFRDGSACFLRSMRGRATTPSDNWVYIQEPDVRIGRLQIFNNWSPALVADPATRSRWGWNTSAARAMLALWSMDNDRFVSILPLLSWRKSD